MKGLETFALIAGGTSFVGFVLFGLEMFLEINKWAWGRDAVLGSAVTTGTFLFLTVAFYRLHDALTSDNKKK